MANGVNMLSDEMDYISRRVRFFEGPEGITLELVQCIDSHSVQESPVTPSRHGTRKIVGGLRGSLRRRPRQFRPAPSVHAVRRDAVAVLWAEHV
jgi:hypothetical protein